MDTWGNWELDRENLTLQYSDNVYYVDLADCRTSAAVLDWIVQIQQKGWISAEDVDNLIQALDDILHLQANLCSSGIEQGPIDVEERVKKFSSAKNEPDIGERLGFEEEG